MEPYGRPHNVLYVVVAPDNEFLLGQTTIFFQQLGVMYEQCRLGHHRPLNDKLRDGILRVGRTTEQKVAGEPLADWLRDIGWSSLTEDFVQCTSLCPISGHPCRV